MVVRVHTPESSNVEELAYDKGSQILCVRFVNGGIYVYRDVPLEALEGILEAHSVGSAFNQLIRSQDYEYERVK